MLPDTQPPPMHAIQTTSDVRQPSVHIRPRGNASASKQGGEVPALHKQTLKQMHFQIPFVVQ